MPYIMSKDGIREIARASRKAYVLDMTYRSNNIYKTAWVSNGNFEHVALPVKARWLAGYIGAAKGKAGRRRLINEVRKWRLEETN